MASYVPFCIEGSKPSLLQHELIFAAWTPEIQILAWVSRIADKLTESAGAVNSCRSAARAADLGIIICRLPSKAGSCNEDNSSVQVRRSEIPAFHFIEKLVEVHMDLGPLNPVCLAGFLESTSRKVLRVDHEELVRDANHVQESLEPVIVWYRLRI